MIAFEWPPPERGETNKLKGTASQSKGRLISPQSALEPLLEHKVPQGRRAISACRHRLEKSKLLTRCVPSNGLCPTVRLRGGTLRSDSCCLPLLRPRRSNYHRCFTDGPGVPDAINKLRQSPGILAVSAAAAMSWEEMEGSRLSATDSECWQTYD